MLCRCLAALAEWERLASLIRREWTRMEPGSAREMAPVAAHAAWHMGHWQVLCLEHVMSADLHHLHVF